MEKVVSYKIMNHMAEIVMSRPAQYNSFNMHLREELLRVMAIIEKYESVRVVILRGDGPGFSAGADLNEAFPPPISAHLKEDYKPIFDKIIDSKFLYIASVHGAAAGIAAAMALACDFLVMSKDSKISIIFTNIGLVPDGGTTWLLERALGYRKALQIIAEGGHISAIDCLKYGLANKIFTEKEIVVETIKWARELCERAPLALTASKKLLRSVAKKSYSDAFLDEAYAQDNMSVSVDFNNARVAFFNKEKPTFEGK